jgi:tetratricopeptide (TPR) repeat protein
MGVAFSGGAPSATAGNGLEAARVIGSNRLGIFRKIWPASLGPGHYVFAAVLLFRLVALIRLASSPLLLPGGSDMQFYDDWAKQILHGHWTDHQAFYGLPLYPFLLALLYRIFGYGPFVSGFLQAALDAGTAGLIYKITTRFMTPASGVASTAAKVTGILAAAGWCFFVPAEAYSVILMPTAGATFVFWVLVWQIVRTDSAPSTFRCFMSGLLLGVSAMGVATVLFLVPLFLAAIFLRRTNTPQSAMATALLIAGVLAGTAPCWIHNCFVARDPVFLSAHSGINLWLGNNPDATGYPSFPGLHAGQGQMLHDSIDQAEAAVGRALKRSEVSRFWSNKAREYIASNPGPWLKLLARKMANFWNAFEYDDLGVIVNLRQHSVIWPGLHFGLIAIFGLAGAIVSWRAFPGSRWIVAAIALQLAAILPVFVTERYRLPVVPGLLILAGLGLYLLWQNCFAGKFAAAAGQLGPVVVSAFFVTLPRYDPSLWALEAYNSGRLALEAKDLAAAERDLQRAHRLVPDNPETNLALGNLRLAQGNRPDAIAFYEAALRLDPKHKSALNNLGVIALDDHRLAEAKEYFRKALEQDPQNAKTHFLLAKAELALGNIDGARTALAHALEREPDRPEYRQLQEEIERRARP